MTKLEQTVIHAKKIGPETLLQQRPALVTTRKDRAMISRADITPDFLRQVLDYDPETGEFRWKERTPEVQPDDWRRKAFNTRRADTKAGVIKNDTGYLKIKILQVNVYGHRAAYAMMTGQWPTDEVDHINGDRSDNRWDNLRAVTSLENKRNMRMPDANTSGVVGVGREGGRWKAQIRDGVTIRRLGSFATIEEAIIARKAAERALGYHPNHGKRRKS